MLVELLAGLEGDLRDRRYDAALRRLESAALVEELQRYRALLADLYDAVERALKFWNLGLVALRSQIGQAVTLEVHGTFPGESVTVRGVLTLVEPGEVRYREEETGSLRRLDAGRLTPETVVGLVDDDLDRERALDRACFLILHGRRAQARKALAQAANLGAQIARFQHLLERAPW